MKIENHIGLVSHVSPSELSFSGVQDWSAAIDKQFHQHAYPLWGRRTHILPFNDLRSVPHDYWPAIIMDDIKEPGAAGYHTDKNNQPQIFIQFSGDSTSVTISHEAIETVPDPFGNRLIPVNHPEFGAIRVLCEICDPPEAVDYKIDGIAVSDFIKPEWYDGFVTPNFEYSFTGACKRPMELLFGGYFSFIKNGEWRQATWFSGNVPVVRVLGMPDSTKMLREWIDAETSTYKQSLL